MKVAFKKIINELSVLLSRFFHIYSSDTIFASIVVDWIHARAKKKYSIWDGNQISIIYICPERNFNFQLYVKTNDFVFQRQIWSLLFESVYVQMQVIKSLLLYAGHSNPDLDIDSAFRTGSAYHATWSQALTRFFVIRYLKKFI